MRGSVASLTVRDGALLNSAGKRVRTGRIFWISLKTYRGEAAKKAVQPESIL